MASDTPAGPADVVPCTCTPADPARHLSFCQRELVDPETVAAIRADEREACAQLAEQHNATYSSKHWPFADLIRARTTP